ncbi:hypothetical protein P879_01688 [Paragonimus westermani]|uniref:Uncharacterized protein n=1 Tax=Paragonimus westermani TaxID=34504 RepID=A0A8T0DVH0_9TREM|nr:hypothetical protein P879_01688 [Paragonimus westermani]
MKVVNFKSINDVQYFSEDVVVILLIIVIMEAVKKNTNDKINIDLRLLKFSGMNVQNEYITQLLCKVIFDSRTNSAKSSDVFKTKQIYYALLNDGKMNAKLSQPRPLNILLPSKFFTSDTRW